MTDQEKFNELNQSFATIQETFKTLKADMDIAKESGDVPINDKLNACMNAMYGMIENVHKRINQTQADMYAHKNDGHLPKCPSPEHMEAALKALKWDKNFEVAKKTVFASKDLFTIKIK